MLLRRGGPARSLPWPSAGVTAGVMLVAARTLFIEATGDPRDFSGKPVTHLFLHGSPLS